MPDLRCAHYQRPAGPCGTTPARPYLTGPRCAAHTPAALAGKPEPGAGYCAPLRCYCTFCESWEPPPLIVQVPRRRLAPEAATAPPVPALT